MLVIVGLLVLLVSLFVAVVGVLGNSGVAHPLTGTFSVFGYHVTGSTGTVFLSGIVIGAVAMFGLSVLLAGARRTAGRGRLARRDLALSQRETAVANRDRDTLLEHQHEAEAATRRRNRFPAFGHWSRAPESGSVTTEPPGPTHQHQH